MGTVDTIHSNLTYMKDLVAAGWEGIASVRQEFGGAVFSPPLKAAAWRPAAIGAALGAVSAGMALQRRRKSTVAYGGAIGSIVGLGAAMAWSSHRFTRAAAQRGIRRVNAARDAHWLALNPIDYA
jgi:hypothetical protein